MDRAPPMQFCTLVRPGRIEMGWLLKILPQNFPVFIRHEILSGLFKATADAFGCPAPSHNHRTFSKRLESYALFTRLQAEKALHFGADQVEVKARLYKNAYPLGENLRKWLAIDPVQDVMTLGQILYRAIGVEIQGDTGGEIVVERCYFSRFYSASICGLISALDDGVFAGLSGGGGLVFSERITEGRERCRAILRFGKEGLR